MKRTFKEIISALFLSLILFAIKAALTSYCANPIVHHNQSATASTFLTLFSVK